MQSVKLGLKWVMARAYLSFGNRDPKPVLSAIVADVESLAFLRFFQDAKPAAPLSIRRFPALARAWADGRKQAEAARERFQQRGSILIYRPLGSKSANQHATNEADDALVQELYSLIK